MSLPSQIESCDDWGFRITNMGCGFQIRFASGYILSVQFGSYHYCANRNRYEIGQGDRENWAAYGAAGCPNAEVAIIDPDGNFVPWKGENNDAEDVSGWVTPEQMLVMAMACGLWSKQKEKQ